MVYIPIYLSITILSTLMNMDFVIFLVKSMLVTDAGDKDELVTSGNYWWQIRLCCNNIQYPLTLLS